MWRMTLIAFTLFAASQSALARPTNGRCPVLGNPVGDRNQSVTVRGKDYFICCSECGAKLAAEPDRYLDQNGRPRVAASGSSASKVRDHY